jgi:hypothetical protein
MKYDIQVHQYSSRPSVMRHILDLLNSIRLTILNRYFLAIFFLIVSQRYVSAQNNTASSSSKKLIDGNVGGYMIVQTEKVDPSFNAGFSIYAAAWPLLREYPGSVFQSGLFGTWMFPLRDTSIKARLYSDIEGGLGWWRNTQYATVTPKFIMGGVQLGFIAWANGPGAGKGRDWNKPSGKYGVAQLSPWLLFPPDGLNLKNGTCGEMFGYGYLPLPLTEEKKMTAGKNVPTGDQSWTLFLNTDNFKGPVAFFTPYFWSQVTVDSPSVKGLFLDVLPSNANKAFQMETQHIPSVRAVDAKGDMYVRIFPTQYPADPSGSSTLMNRLMVYNRKALWDGVKNWFAGGYAVSGAVDTATGGYMQRFVPGIRSTWKMYGEDIPKSRQAPLSINAQITAQSTDAQSFRINWHSDLITKRKTRYADLLLLPEYYRLQKEGNDTIGKWIAVAAEQVPEETGLRNYRFTPQQSDENGPRGYYTPDDPESSWKKPGPAAGPFKVKIGDGSTVTYYWYRFADQPALLNADLSVAEREEMQKRVEKIHQSWSKEKEYLPPPTVGKLASLDPALIVKPPKGLEIGYVPIVTKQEMVK